jgi:hypothetical protein
MRLYPAQRLRPPLEERRAERELFFWTARQSLKLIVFGAAVIYLLVMLCDGRLVKDVTSVLRLAWSGL